MEQLTERVRAELLALRKSRSGLTVGALSGCPTIVGLLGEGDPSVAYNKLKHRVLSADADTALMAAAASLGLASAGQTHLDRLADFGNEHGYEQRQVRRYSDKGIHQLALLIAGSWSPELSPCLEVLCYQTGSDEIAALVNTKRPYFVEMCALQATLYRGSHSPESLTTSMVESEEAMWSICRATQPTTLRAEMETSVAWTWRGELFPKFSFSWRSELQGFGVTWEALGNRGMLRLLPPLAT